MASGRIHSARVGRLLPSVFGGVILVAELLASGCALPTSPSMASVPRSWRRTNPWGPEANAARAEGRLVPLFYTEQMAEWVEFGRQHVQEGDLLFRYGLAYRLSSKIVNRVMTDISDDHFTHNGIAHWEGDTLYIYDAQPEPEGIRKIPFEFWMLDTEEGSLAIKRLLPPYRCCIPGAVAYCEDAYQRQVPFDPGLRLDDERLYCSEMIEKAFRSAGLALSEPVPIRCLPHFHRYSFLLPIEPLTPYRVDEPIFALGNELYGSYSSPYLETVYGGDKKRLYKPPETPTCPAVPF